MQYWLLVELPKQEKQEPVPVYVLRACATLEKTQKPGEGVKTTAKLAEEDPTFTVRTDEASGQTIISGMGELHLDILVDRMKREFKVM